MQNQKKLAESQDVSHVKSPAQILSAMPLADWRGSATTFQGFTGTKPDQELHDAPWDDVAQLVCPASPAQLANKDDGLFFVPCPLKEAPLIGNTLAAAAKNGHPQTGKMRSKQHVTEASLLVIDVDGLSESDFATGLANIERDGLTFLAYTTHSHGSLEKPGVRVRIVTPLDRPADTEAYAAAWHGFDRQYWNRQAGKADPSGAKLYQQQGTWCCEKSRVGKAECWTFRGGVASTDALVSIGKRLSAANLRVPKPQNPAATPASGCDTDYPPSDANKIADACQQIGRFRDTKGAGQPEPLWYDCLGVVGYCANGEALCQAWSNGYIGYDARETSTKLANRMRTPPTTCAQFQKTNSDGCDGCTQTCNSPITLGRESRKDFNVVPFEVVKAKQHIATATTEPVVTPLLPAKSPAGTVKSERRNEEAGSNSPFPEIEPYPEPVVLASLLDEIAATLLRFVVMDKEQADAASLWVVHTYLLDAFDTSPIAIINAPEKACAKTLCQTILAQMSYRPLPAANASASALFRSIEKWRPTIFFDEADTFFRDNAELQGMVNAGYKRSGFVLRSEAVANTFEPRSFSVYSAKSIAGIALERHLSDATMSRGVVLNLRRKMQHESVSRLRDADPGLFVLIASKLLRFAADEFEQVRLARPVLPAKLNDRAQDNWEPLLAIAQCAGQGWVTRATTAALLISGANDAQVSTGNELLADIQDVFEAKGVDKISSADLIQALCEIEDGAWATYSNGRPISPRQLSKLLSTYKISPKTVRMKHGTPKGYDLAQFADAFARYLAPRELPQQLNDWQEGMPGKAPGVADPTQPPSRTSTAQNPGDPTIATEVGQQEPTCGGVADVAAPTRWPGGTPPEDAF